MKGWLDNFGKADNANDSNVSLPEGFVGVGYDTKGRNYSPAWGGQFAMGGSIPGSVGFTYARTAGAAPSKGKYAKKTMASAQIGKNVKKDATNIDTGIANKIAGLELQQNPEYQRLKYLQSLPQLRQAPGRGEELVREGLATADIATDLMQIGNFIPHPMAQGVGKAGNILGSGVDLAQALMSARQGDYLDAAINLGSVGLAGGLAANTFRRNSKYLQPGQPLYALSPQAFGSLSRTNYIEPFRKVGKMTDKNLLANRALLGLIGAETVYDAIPQKEYGGDIPSAQNGIMSPMLLARNVLNYFYPSEGATPTVGAAPVEYKKGLTDELLKRQAYKESTFNPSAVSPAGYKGLTQIGEEVLTDYSKKKGGKKLDPFNPKDAVELQKFAMDDLYNASFINKPNQPDSIRIAKTLAAYNWGRGNLFNYLNEQKQKGVDIYGSYDWLNDLPKETSDYVNKILLQEDQSFNKNYKRDSTNPKYKDVTSLYDKKKFGGKVTTAQNGQEMKFYQNGLDWKPKSMQDGGEESLIGKATKFVSEEISDPVTTAALALLNKIKPLSNTEVYKTVRPVDYPNALKLPMHAYDYVMGNESEPLKTKSGKPHLAEEFWATAMNIPGERQYLKESQYKPSKSKDPDAKYYTIRDVIDDYQLMNLTKDLKPGEKMTMNGLSPILDTKWYSENAKTDKGVKFDEIDPLQRFTLEKSPDGSYVSIYDKYDFNNPALNRMMNPIEIYDRFYIPKKKDGGSVNDKKNPKENKEIDRVSVSDPRYPELYKNRQVGAYYDGAYSLPDLPEVTVTAPRSYTMDSLRNFTTAALYGAPATAMNLSMVPQAAMTEGIEALRGKPYDFSNAGPNLGYFTSNQRDLSQTMGYENPQGFLQNAANVGLSMIDPLSLIGVGAAADDIVKGGLKGIRKKAISQAPSPRLMMDNAVASATPNVSTVTNQQQIPHLELLQEMKQNVLNRMNTPEGKKRLQEMINKNFWKYNQGWGKPVDGWGEFLLQGLKNFEFSGVKKMSPEDMIEDFKKLEFVPDLNNLGKFNAGYHRKGKYEPGSTPIIYMGEGLTPDDVKHIFDHEVGHFFQRHTETNVDDMLSKIKLKKREDLPSSNAINEDFESVGNSAISTSGGYDPATSFNYFLRGSGGREKLPFAAEVRKNLLERGLIKDYYDEITPDLLEKHYDLYNKTGGNKYVLRLYEIMEKDPKNFKILSQSLNKLPAATLPIAGGAAATISALQNQQPVQKQKNGGITKDNLGYWNPENWGKPVEIDSNNITMEGVYEPLLGISDTGDTKLMKPGKNYKFKGKKVTEFPVAELGINQLDAQPMKKLNQLLNFTNNPDKDNWLDKYN